MPYWVSLADLRSAGCVLAADEAVAITRQLIERPSDEAPAPPFGPLAASRIRLGSDGSVVCAGCAATPTVAEVAILLQELLERTPRVPGGLRYLIARALHDVDAPPFDSVADFSLALSRHAPARGDEVVRQLVVRRDRRRSRQSAAELRLQLREADRRLFEAQVSRQPSASVRNGRAHAWMIAALFIGALTMIATASAVGHRAPMMPTPPAPPVVRPELPAAIHGELHPVVVSPAPHRVRTAPKRPVRAANTRTIRLRWLHTTIAIKDDLAR